MTKEAAQLSTVIIPTAEAGTISANLGEPMTKGTESQVEQAAGKVTQFSPDTSNHGLYIGATIPKSALDRLTRQRTLVAEWTAQAAANLATTKSLHTRTTK